MRLIKGVLVALVAICALGPRVEAQSSLPISLFERYVESFRLQSGIPGMSAALVQDGRIVWDRGFGYQDVEALVAASSATPYPLHDLTQTLSSTLVLQQCVDVRHYEASDRIRRWFPQYPEETTTIAHLLSHTSPSGGFKYDASRFATLSDIAERCANSEYAPLLADEILDFLGMADSVPGQDLGDSSSPNRSLFSSAALARYSALLGRVAVPYRVDGRGRASRTEYPRSTFSASTGVVSTVRDLARFDAALDHGDLLASGTLRRAWEPSGSMPIGLGWFVQRFNGERVVWHFGLARDVSSCLYIKVPGRNLSVILLANSDGLAAPYTLSSGDLTASVFAQAFLKLFVS